MNAKQKKFAELYAANPNATEAAKGAGYSEKTARSQGQRLLTNVDIKKYINELQEEAASERIMSLAEVKAFWSDTMNDTKEKMSNRLKASELLARSAGAFIPSGKSRRRHQGIRPQQNNRRSFRGCKYCIRCYTLLLKP